MSGALISACVQPLDVLRTRMQGDAAQGASRSTLATLQLVVKQYGIRCISPHGGQLSLGIGGTLVPLWISLCPRDCEREKGAEKQYGIRFI